MTAIWPSGNLPDFAKDLNTLTSEPNSDTLTVTLALQSSLSNALQALETKYYAAYYQAQADAAAQSEAAGGEYPTS